MHAFIATVPFTILEAVNYVIENKIEDADIYVVNVFAGADETAERIRKTEIFKNVFFMDDVLLTYPITLKKCVNVVCNGKKFIKNNRRKYEYVYYNNSGWLINSIFYTCFSRNNKELKNVFLEHGYYSYTKDYARKPWYLRGLICMMGLKCMDGSMLDEIEMFHPELMKVRHDGVLEKMPKINKSNNTLKRALNDIFEYKPEEDEFISKDIIIFEQGQQKFDFDKDKFWNRVFEIIDKDRAVVKAHPRQRKSTLSGKGIAVSLNHTIPWEIEIMNVDIHKKVQITIFSGACVSPKLLFDEEPIVIFLYKLLPLEASVWGEDMIKFANELGNTYQDKSKYFIPETFEEFEEYCKKIGIGRK